MKSFRQFIIEAPKDDDPNVDYELRRDRAERKKGSPLSKSEQERLKKEVEKQFKNRKLTPSQVRGIGTEIDREVWGDKDGPRYRNNPNRSSGQSYNKDALELRKLAAQERTKFKKTTKAERAKHIGKPTHISKKHGVKYIPPKSVPDSELTGPNTKGEIVSRRRAKRSIDVGRKPEKISDVKKKIDSIDAYNRRHKKAEYSTSTQAKNRYGGKSVQDSRGRWVPDPVEDGKPIKEPGNLLTDVSHLRL